MHLKIQGRSACGPHSPFLLETHNDQWWLIKDFYFPLDLWMKMKLCNSFRTHVFILNLQKAVKITAIMSLYGIKFLCETHKILAVAWVWGKKRKKNQNQNRIHQARDSGEILNRERGMHFKRQLKCQYKQHFIWDQWWSLMCEKRC